jgi:hypothetical protein
MHTSYATLKCPATLTKNAFTQNTVRRSHAHQQQVKGSQAGEEGVTSRPHSGNLQQSPNISSKLTVLAQVTPEVTMRNQQTGYQKAKEVAAPLTTCSACGPAPPKSTAGLLQLLQSVTLLI